jgi:hypothetical protein
MSLPIFDKNARSCKDKKINFASLILGTKFRFKESENNLSIFDVKWKTNGNHF